jgi:hypothetical protein
MLSPPASLVQEPSPGGVEKGRTKRSRVGRAVSFHHKRHGLRNSCDTDCMHSVTLVGIKEFVVHTSPLDIVQLNIEPDIILKVKCDGRQPTCIPCANYGIRCTYLEKPRHKPKIFKHSRSVNLTAS